ncbi:MAG: hypothetical protein M3R24_41585 [Chloroflexota bacterium]|nr:hypothetical protein [Chloroflexota bacterium]
MHRVIRLCLTGCAILLVACGSPNTATQRSFIAAPVESVAPLSQASASVEASSAPSLPPTTVESPLPAAADQEQEAGWIELSPSGKGFSVLMPGKPDLDKQYLETPFGRVPVSIYPIELPTVTYMTGLITYPKDFVRASDPSKMLAGAQAGAIKNIDGRLVHEEEITIDGYPGRAFTAEGTVKEPSKTQLPVGSLVHGRLFVVENNLYQLIVFGAKENLPKSDIDKFFSSFKLTEK